MPDVPDPWIEGERKRRDRRQQRARMTLLARLRQTEIERERLSTVGAAKFSDTRGKPDSMPPPRQDEVDFKAADVLIRIGTEMREAALDELAGLGPARDIANMSALDKDRLLVGDLASLTPAQAEVAYAGRLGSAETIRRVRSRARRNYERSEALRADGWPMSEIRERLGVTEDDLIVARDWALQNEGQLRAQAERRETADTDRR